MAAGIVIFVIAYRKYLAEAMVALEKSEPASSDGLARALDKFGIGTSLGTFVAMAGSAILAVRFGLWYGRRRRAKTAI